MKTLKNYLLLICAILSTGLLFSQQITIEKNRFKMEGKKISEKEVKKLLESNTEAAALFKSYRTKGSVGGFLLGFGGGLIIGDVLGGATADVQYPTAVTYIGIACVAVSIPIISGRNKKRDQAIELYNKGLKNTSSNYELNIMANQNGYGLKLQF